MMTADEFQPIDGNPLVPMDESTPVSHLSGSLSDVDELAHSEETGPSNTFAAADTADQMTLDGAKVAAKKDQINFLLDTDALIHPEFAVASGFVSDTAVHQSVMMRLSTGCSLPAESSRTQYIIGAVLQGGQVQLQLDENDPINLQAGDHFCVPPGVSYSLRNRADEALIKFVVTK